ncbi:MAG: winged helix-turn-helix transcriptional regulator [Thermoplasmatales archaeon]|nr:MAG: winged helix-turn-helix transcriptional regulator [Thermoplasmatales archaeon]
MKGKIDVLYLEKRRKIYNFILKCPGIHFSDLSRKLNIPKTTLSHHIKYLKKHNLIVEKKLKKYFRYYVSYSVSREDKELFDCIRKKIPRNILLLFLIDLCLTRQDISRELEIHPNTVAYHLKNMLKLDIIENVDIDDKDGYVPVFPWREPKVLKFEPVSSEVIYRLRPSSVVRLYKAFVAHKNSLSEDFNSRFMIGYLEGNDRWETESKNKIFTARKGIDNAMKAFLEVCPLPFCA